MNIKFLLKRTHGLVLSSLKNATLFIVIFLSAFLNTNAQTLVFKENFKVDSVLYQGTTLTTRIAEDVVNMIYTSNINTNASTGTVISVSADNLLSMAHQANNAGNVTYLVGNNESFNNSYKQTLSENEMLVTWYSYMNRSLGGTLATNFNNGRHTTATILACDNEDPTNSAAKGIALFQFASGDGRAVFLKYFTSGILNADTTNTNLIAKSKIYTNSTTTYILSKVEYNSVGNEWKLFTKKPTSVNNVVSVAPVNSDYDAARFYTDADLPIGFHEVSMEYFGFAAANPNNSGSAVTSRLGYFHVYVGLPEQTLPVKLSSFTGKSSTDNIKLNWQTASESNNSHFEILRSANAKDFSVINSVKGNGNSETLKNYSFTDYAPLAGANYYQLNQVDLDGNSSLSDIIVVNFSLSNNPLLNVFTKENHTNFQYASKSNTSANLLILDLGGKVIYSEKIQVTEGVNDFSLPLQLAKGIYIASITAGKEKTSVKFSKD